MSNPKDNQEQDVQVNIDTPDEQITKSEDKPDAIELKVIDDNRAGSTLDKLPIFDVAGIVAPNEATEGATMPEFEPVEPKRGRGRPRKDGTSGAKKKAGDASAEIADHIQAAALYNMVLVTTCRAISDEFAQTDATRDETLKAAATYFESVGVNLPPWAGLLAVSVVQIGAAINTPKGTSKLQSFGNKLRAWWLLKRGR